MNPLRPEADLLLLHLWQRPHLKACLPPTAADALVIPHRTLGLVVSNRSRCFQHRCHRINPDWNLSQDNVKNLNTLYILGRQYIVFSKHCFSSLYQSLYCLQNCMAASESLVFWQEQLIQYNSCIPLFIFDLMQHALRIMSVYSEHAYCVPTYVLCCEWTVCYICSIQIIQYIWGKIVIYCPYISDAKCACSCVGVYSYAIVCRQCCLSVSSPGKGSFSILTHPRPVYTHTCTGTHTAEQSVRVLFLQSSSPFLSGHVGTKSMYVCVCAFTAQYGHQYLKHTQSCWQ